MDKFESMRAFVKVVEHRGFAAAARVLNQSRSSVNKHVINLEEHLGVQLLTRTTRKVSTTETGVAFYERCLAILGDLESAELAAAQLRDEVIGTLKVNAPMTFGVMHLGRVVTDFMARHPEVRIELTLTDRFSDPVEDGTDVTLRIAEPPSASSLTAHEIVEMRRVLCAAPAYLAKNGTPAHPNDLSDHTCLHYGYLATGNVWPLSGPDGPHEVRVNGALCSNNGAVLRDAALAGRGIAFLPTFIVGGALQDGRLRTLLTDYQPPRLGLYVLYPPNRYLNAKVRLFSEFLSERFAGPPYWDLAGET